MTITKRRQEALALFEQASAAPDTADWRQVAERLAAVVPQPRKIEPQASDSGLEWETYPPTVTRQNGRNFHPSKGATFKFADGITVRAPLMHHQKRDKPDWSRSARMAVHFWRAKRAGQIRALAGLETWREAERYARECEVPAIVSAEDERRAAPADAEQANLETAELRKGSRQYLGDVIELAAKLDGDRGLAAHAALVGYDPLKLDYEPGEMVLQGPSFAERLMNIAAE